MGTGASDGGLVGILNSSDDNNYRLTIYKKGLFVCLFVCFICLLCGVEISQILGPLGLCFLFLRTARKKAFLVSEYLVEGFNEVVFLSFKTCHVREAFFFFFFCGNFFVILWEIFWRIQNFPIFS